MPGALDRLRKPGSRVSNTFPSSSSSSNNVQQSPSRPSAYSSGPQYVMHGPPPGTAPPNRHPHPGGSSSQAVPPYASSSRPVRLAEKTLPPGAATAPQRSPNAAERERDELDRAIRESREQAELEEIMRRSRLEEEEADAARQRELEAEEAVLRQSQHDHEAQLSAQEVAKYEEEESLRRAIEESEREARRASKGKSPAVVDSVSTHSRQDDDEDDLSRTLEMSRIQYEQERRSSESIRRLRQPHTQESLGRERDGADQSRSGRPDHQPTPPVLPARLAPKRIPAHVVNQTSDDESPPAYEQATSPSTSSGPSVAASLRVREEAARNERKRLCFYPPVAPDMTEGSMRVVVPHMLFATRARRSSDDLLPMTSLRYEEDEDTPQPSLSRSTLPASQAREETIVPRPRRRPLPPIPLEERPSSTNVHTGHGTSFYTAPSIDSRAALSRAGSPSSEGHAQLDSEALVVQDEDDPFNDSHAATPDLEEENQDARSSHYRYQISAHTRGGTRAGSGESDHDGEDEIPAEPSVGRHDYGQSSLGIDGLPRASSPEPMRDDPMYDTDQTGGSFESTASDTEPETPRLDESAQSISSNVSFGFNPLSSPTQHLDWQGRFPDVVVLSKYVDDGQHAVARTAASLQKEDYRTFAFEAPTWRELIAYLMWHGNSVFKASERDLKEPRDGALQVSLILEFVKELAPSQSLVRLQVHLLGDSPILPAAGSRGVSLSRRPLSGKSVSSLPTQSVQPQRNDNGLNVQGPASQPVHLVIAFPKPFHSLPLTLGTIGNYLHNAHKAALSARNGAGGQTQNSVTAQNNPGSASFLQDLLRGIEFCSGASDVRETDDGRIEKLVDRLRSRRHRIRGTFRELHRKAKRRTKRSSTRGSQNSHLESQPLDQDYHITPYSANNEG